MLRFFQTLIHPVNMGNRPSSEKRDSVSAAADSNVLNTFVEAANAPPPPNAAPPADEVTKRAPPPMYAAPISSAPVQPTTATVVVTNTDGSLTTDAVSPVPVPKDTVSPVPVSKDTASSVPVSKDTASSVPLTKERHVNPIAEKLHERQMLLVERGRQTILQAIKDWSEGKLVPVEVKDGVYVKIVVDIDLSKTVDEDKTWAELVRVCAAQDPPITLPAERHYRYMYGPRYDEQYNHEGKSKAFAVITVSLA